MKRTPALLTELFLLKKHQIYLYVHENTGQVERQPGLNARHCVFLEGEGKSFLQTAQLGARPPPAPAKERMPSLEKMHLFLDFRTCPFLLPHLCNSCLSVPSFGKLNAVYFDRRFHGR